MFGKPFAHRHARRRYHTERIIWKRAKTAYKVGYNTQRVSWHPYIVCTWPYHIPVPLRRLTTHSGTFKMIRREPDHKLADHTSCSCEICKPHKYVGNSRRDLPAVLKRAWLDYEQQLDDFFKKE